MFQVKRESYEAPVLDWFCYSRLPDESLDPAFEDILERSTQFGDQEFEISPPLTPVFCSDQDSKMQELHFPAEDLSEFLHPSLKASTWIQKSPSFEDENRGCSGSNQENWSLPQHFHPVRQSDPEGPIQPVKPPIQLKQKKTSVKSIDRSHLKRISKIVWNEIKLRGFQGVSQSDLKELVHESLSEESAKKLIQNKHYVNRDLQKVLKVLAASSLTSTDQNMVRAKNRSLADVCALEARKYAHEQRNVEKRAQLSHLNSMYQTMQQLMKHHKAQQETHV